MGFSSLPEPVYPAGKHEFACLRLSFEGETDENLIGSPIVNMHAAGDAMQLRLNASVPVIPEAALQLSGIAAGAGICNGPG